MTPVATSFRTSLRITCARSFAELTEHATAWNRLAGEVPFRRWEWCESWWRHFARPADSLLIPLVWDAEDTLIGAAPFYVQTSLLSGRTIRLLGDGEVCSDYLSIIAVPGLERIVAQRIARWLCCHVRRDWDLVKLEGVAGDDPGCAWLAESMHRLGHLVVQRHLANAWRIALPRSWPDLVAKMSKPRRRKIKTLESRYFAAGKAKLHTVDDAGKLACGLEVLHRLHQRRRESKGDKGCFASDRFAAFHADVARQLLAAGALRLNWIELDGEPVAVDYGFNGGGVAYAYQSGFDPAAALHNPGWMQTIASLRQAINAGYEHFDFMRGDEPYKAGWQAQAVPLSEMRIVGGHLPAHLRHAAWTLLRKPRKLLDWSRQILTARRHGAPQEPAFVETDA
ncbi:MAG TPA: GNAT family N-acetyltransferase [Pirellulales bacterium]|jgi:CelD/BcsL family acetyltransferase involved in cellulose biosynthesis|nr:GNAT family N-acetyltransferase [Pirellulales bacterium]